MYHEALSGRLACGKEEKQAVFKTVRKLVRLSQDVRKEGLLCLDGIADHEEDVFLRSCLRYIVEEGTDDFQEYASIWLLATEESGARLLEMAVIADGLEQILLQRAPCSILRRLGAWLGTDFVSEVETELDAMEQQEIEKQWSACISRKTSFEPAFDTLSDFSDIHLTGLLEQAEERTLALVIIGASGAVIQRFQKVASPRLWEWLKREMKLLQYPRACDVRTAQQQLLELWNMM